MTTMNKHRFKFTYWKINPEVITKKKRIVLDNLMHKKYNFNSDKEYNDVINSIADNKFCYSCGNPERCMIFKF